MYDILQLNDMLVPELRELAETLGVDGFKKLNKQELVYTILDHQALAGEKKKSSGNGTVEGHLPDEVPVSSDNMRVDKRQPNTMRKRPRKMVSSDDAKSSLAEKAEEEVEEKKTDKTEQTTNDTSTQHRNRQEPRRPAHQEKRSGLQLPREPRLPHDRENRERTQETREPRENRPPHGPRNPGEMREQRNPNETRENRTQDQPERINPGQQSDNRNQQRDLHREARERFNVEVDGIIEGEGVLEMMSDGYGFLRSSD